METKRFALNGLKKITAVSFVRDVMERDISISCSLARLGNAPFAMDRVCMLLDLPILRATRSV